MHSPARRRSFPEHLHILGHDQRRQDIADPVHQIGPEALGLIVLDEAFEPPVAYGSNNHLLVVYGITVRFASAFSATSLQGKRPLRSSRVALLTPEQLFPGLRHLLTYNQRDHA